MQNTSGSGIALRPAPFVGGRAVAPRGPASSQRQRPFAPGARSIPDRAAADAADPIAVPRWHMVHYSPSMAEEDQQAAAAPSQVAGPAVDDAPAAARDAATAQAVSVLRAVADRLERGEIQLPAESAAESEPAVVAAVLSMLSGAAR